MTITFFINYLNHHQVAVADEMYRLLGEDFKVVATFPRNEGELKGGKDYSVRPYCLLAAECETAKTEARRLNQESDVCVFGAGNLDWEKERATTGKLSFEMSERWFKRGLVNILSPRLLKWWWLYQTKLRKRPFYKLCSSAYTASDCRKLGTFKNRCYKWGYFPALPQPAVKRKNLEAPGASRVKIAWVARFLLWKHPEAVVRAASRLAAEGFAFRIDMVGDGPERPKIIDMVSKLGLEDYIHLPGAVPNAEVLRAMSDADIFLFTSDRREGWGAVVNEAMSCGCCVIANDQPGSVPYLIRDGINGLTYHNGNPRELADKLKFLLENPAECKKMGAQAFRDITHTWSPATAAQNLITLSTSLLHHQSNPITQGPCSKA